MKAYVDSSFKDRIYNRCKTLTVCILHNDCQVKLWSTKILGLFLIFYFTQCIKAISSYYTIHVTPF